MCNEIHDQRTITLIKLWFYSSMFKLPVMSFRYLFTYLRGTRTHMHAEARRGCQMTLELELQVLVSYLTSVLAIKLKFFEKAANAFNYPVIFLAPQVTSRTISVLPTIS